MNYLTAAWAALVRLVRPDVDAIISAFVKAQTKLGKLVEREEAALESEARAIEALLISRTDRNSVINRAYRIIHSLDVLTV